MARLLIVDDEESYRQVLSVVFKDEGYAVETASDGKTALAHLNDEIQLQRLRVFKATMRTVQDIVNNLLNGLQLAQVEGEGQQSAEMQVLVDRMIQDASAKLRSLGNLEAVEETEMAAGLGIDYPGANR